MQEDSVEISTDGPQGLNVRHTAYSTTNSTALLSSSSSRAPGTIPAAITELP